MISQRVMLDIGYPMQYDRSPRNGLFVNALPLGTRVDSHIHEIFVCLSLTLGLGRV
jgi:hypothetical protein